MTEKRDPLGRIEEAYEAWHVDNQHRKCGNEKAFRAGYLAGLGRAEEIAEKQAWSHSAKGVGGPELNCAAIVQAIRAEKESNQ